MPHFRLSLAPGAALRIHARISRSFFRAALGASLMYSVMLAGRSFFKFIVCSVKFLCVVRSCCRLIADEDSAIAEGTRFRELQVQPLLDAFEHRPAPPKNDRSLRDLVFVDQILLRQ